ncbi:3-methyl-2-oxobutanoate hydroxymethyltransferase [Leucobacter sp. OLJS4]|uniref:3-methyl-2-oxobutanoate hydroxymethyltransferase n=1 Tax=unclassified Leucobacter TaxID=2621730 RepID=UPI000C17D5A3|nr:MULTISPECIES: 3-methyl-2-oxobutanoate hydroxymethyltransferase [unclassified Leucobacter]PII84073.1 3-methyl-2-oxobutanoate hydroxymethyltransferase [Leucobacter sp. OLCALW19]PII88321.1 3-methyl-2-oxobutanoate hydroxymethyltransferase [Leucobacter sp. OLTLW20]PII92312.1 3-methyl-2-oxobutanoate hydroxymethyltransferase [Leucobacter sp. OLAS13]PII99705.1 3-methyl-2-oxobutanoate hydroxymethyltransferase [Leucobacter sp. OLDS2]PIJ02955.1 3-methyl-2-oxobutanoate hydroxymethyltransferase [Leucoba
MTRITIPELEAKKAAGEPIVMVTAYDYPGARAVERAGVDMVLVGDSGAQVVLGHDSTVSVTTDEMLVLAKAVRRGTERAFVVCDVPFGSTEVSDAQAVETAIRFAKEAGADAVKLEGGSEARLSRIRAIVAAGIPVVGHIGLTPQTAVALGGLRAQGRTTASAERLVAEALGVQAAGAFCLVIEAVPAEITELLRSALRIPIIGIGAGRVDGQVLVLHDLLGITEGRTAKFVKRFGTVGDDMTAALSAYAAEVRAGEFPGTEHQYAASDEAVEAARATLAALTD